MKTIRIACVYLLSSLAFPEGAAQLIRASLNHHRDKTMTTNGIYNPDTAPRSRVHTARLLKKLVKGQNKAIMKEAMSMSISMSMPTKEKVTTVAPTAKIATSSTASTIKAGKIVPKVDDTESIEMIGGAYTTSATAASVTTTSATKDAKEKVNVSLVTAELDLNEGTATTASITTTRATNAAKENTKGKEMGADQASVFEVDTTTELFGRSFTDAGSKVAKEDGNNREKREQRSRPSRGTRPHKKKKQNSSTKNESVKSEGERTRGAKSGGGKERSKDAKARRKVR